MLKTLMFQAFAVVLVAALMGAFIGWGGARSVLAGGAAYVLPNLLFALRLKAAIAARRVGTAGFLIGEAVKLAAVVALLLWLPRVVEIHWPALLVGLFVVMFVNLFALLHKT